MQKGKVDKNTTFLSSFMGPLLNELVIFWYIMLVHIYYIILVIVSFL